MQQAQGMLQHIAQNIQRCLAGTFLLLIVKTSLREFDVPVAELIPYELVNHAACFAQLEFLQVLRDIVHGSAITGKDPPIREGVILLRRHKAVVKTLQIHEHVAGCIPDLIGEIAGGFHTLPVETHIIARRVARNQHEAQCICTVLVHDFHRINAVPEGFRHFASLAVPNKTVNEYVAEGNVLPECQAHHDHAGHPEENDIISRNQSARGIEMFEFLCFLRPPHGLKGPKSGTEPGIQHILILMNVPASAFRTGLHIHTGNCCLPAILAIPCGNAMPPPKLTGNTPVTDVLQPIAVNLRKTIRNEPDAPILHSFDGRLCQGIHFYEPLFGNQGFDGRMTAGAMPHSMLMLLRAHEDARLLQFLHQCLAACIAIHALVLSCAFPHGAVVLNNLDLLQIVAEPHFKIVGIVGRRHLHCPRTKGRIHIGIGKQGDASVHNGQDEDLAHQLLVAFVIGMHCHACIAEHGFRSGRGNLHISIHPLYLITKMPEMPLFCFMIHLNIRKRRIAIRTPIRNTGSLIDEPLLVKAHKDFPHCLGTSLVHGEAFPLPVAGGTKCAKLIHDAAAIRFLPLPDTLQEFFAPELIAVRPLLPESRLHLCLCRNPRMIAAGHPKSVIPLHTPPANENILESIVHSMSHMELSGHIGRRNDNAVRRFPLLHLCMEKAALLPILIPFLLKGLGIVHLGNIVPVFLIQSHKHILL